MPPSRGLKNVFFMQAGQKAPTLPAGRQVQGRRLRGNRSVLWSYVGIPDGPGLYRESDMPLISDSR
jgi:hypothetical protein